MRFTPANPASVCSWRRSCSLAEWEMFEYYFDQYNLTMMTSRIIFILVLVVIEYGLVIPVRNR